MVICYSVMNHALQLHDLQDIVFDMYSVTVGCHWASNFLQRNKQEIGSRKSLLLTSKRVEGRMADDVVEFIQQVDSVSNVHPMCEDTVGNYNET